jgi:hypothetical protein
MHTAPFAAASSRKTRVQFALTGGGGDAHEPDVLLRKYPSKPGNAKVGSSHVAESRHGVEPLVHAKDTHVESDKHCSAHAATSAATGNASNERGQMFFSVLLDGYSTKH